MTESKVEYNAGDKVTPDNVGAAMRQITENYIAQLERTIDGYNMIQHRHAEMIAERDARIAELEAQVRRMVAEIPYEQLRYIVNSHPNLPVGDRITASRWLDTVKVTP